MSNDAEWVKRLGPEAAHHRRNYMRSLIALACYFFLVAIWIPIGYVVTQNANRNVAATLTLITTSGCFTVVYLIQAHYQRVAIRSASAALRLDEHAGIKALPEPALRSLAWFDVWTRDLRVSWVQPPTREERGPVETTHSVSPALTAGKGMAASKAGRVGGPTAYTMLIIRSIVYGAFAVDMVLLLGMTIVHGVVPSAVASGTSLIGTMLVVGAAMIATAPYAEVIKFRELRSGYTTIPGKFRSAEMRDPKTGHVLRRAGDPLPDRPGLKAARAYAREHYGVNS